MLDLESRIKIAVDDRNIHEAVGQSIRKNTYDIIVNVVNAPTEFVYLASNEIDGIAEFK
jgi:hypothetical protein